ncbi:MAG TPA: hypothetical protein VJO34_03475 [Methylomirabilota bacterium]|nr:hypothetical protein [Methylomirabilota bacterium]
MPFERVAVETGVAPSRWLYRLWSLLVVGLLLTSFGLGFQASRGAVSPDLHAAVAFVVAAIVIASHVRLGDGWDLLAAVALLGAVALGFALKGGGATNLHRTFSLLAVVLSAVTHLRRWRE